MECGCDEIVPNVCAIRCGLYVINRIEGTEETNLHLLKKATALCQVILRSNNRNLTSVPFVR